MNTITTLVVQDDLTADGEPVIGYLIPSKVHPGQDWLIDRLDSGEWGLWPIDVTSLNPERLDAYANEFFEARTVVENLNRYGQPDRPEPERTAPSEAIREKLLACAKEIER